MTLDKWEGERTYGAPRGGVSEGPVSESRPRVAPKRFAGTLALPPYVRIVALGLAWL